MIKRLLRKIAALTFQGSLAAQALVDGEIFLNRAVIVHVGGGLANQMICYRAGRMLAIANNATLVLDNHWFGHLDTDSARNYQLHHFPICPDISMFSEVALKNLLRNNPVEVIEREHIPESHATEIPELFRLSGERRIIFFDFWGAWHLCWLAERFFENNDMLSELTLNRDTELEERDRCFLEHIEEARNPVAIHVRRGGLRNSRRRIVIEPGLLQPIHPQDGRCSARTGILRVFGRSGVVQGESGRFSTTPSCRLEHGFDRIQGSFPGFAVQTFHSV